MRNEKKYYLSHIQAANLLTLTNSLLKRDKHSLPNGGYLISSVYFDTPSLDFYYEKENGIFHRKKYRIRYYNNDYSYISLECKEKLGSVTKKTSERISKEEFDRIMSGDISVFANAEEPLKKEFFGLYKEKNIRPKCNVIYNREAFVHPLSNTRITFDNNIKVSNTGSSDEYFVFENNPVVLEIKYDKFFPKYLSDILSVSQKEISVSKYQSCIKYLLQNKGWLL